MENIDVSFGAQLSKRHQVLTKYTTVLKQLRSKAEGTYDIRSYAFDNFVYFQYFKYGRSNLSESLQPTSSDTSIFPNFSIMTFLRLELLNQIFNRRRQILCWLIYLLLAIICIFVYRHEPSSSAAEQSVRSMVYPGMRMWRRLTLPLIERFPRLTELYDESCLMENPFFQIDDISCSPCSHVKSLIDLTSALKSDYEINESIRGYDSIKNLKYKAEYVPFVFKISHQPIELQDVYNMYFNNKEIFERDAYRVHSTNRNITNLEELFNQFNQSFKGEANNMWRCNRLLPARLLRKLIARPSTLPSSMALERYMVIDTPQAKSYSLPDTECPNVYIQQSQGNRFIILRPTSECRHRCRTISIRLPQSYVLSYNSWYWKPISAPDPVSDSLSISLIGSYC